MLVLNNGTITGKKGDKPDRGIILKHKKTGKWIIAQNANDKNAKEIGGCTNGPAVIDFKHKKYHTC